MKTDTDTRQYARKIVDDFIYELQHSITEPQIDFSRVRSREIIALIDHIEQLIIKAMKPK